MIERALDSVGDWTFGIGKNNYLFGQLAIVQDIKTRLLEFLNDCFFSLDSGMDWNTLLGSLGATKMEQQLLLTCRAIILKTYGVVKVISLSASIGAGRVVHIQGVISTIYTSQYTINLQGVL